MLIKVKRGWERSERDVTPESVFRARRDLLKGLAAGPILLGGAAALGGLSGRAEAQAANPSDKFYPFAKNDKYKPPRAFTPEKDATTYNNYYEFGSSKRISEAAAKLPLRPWTVKLDGMVDKPIEIGIDDLIEKMPREERIYSHRCVEAWSMVVPWSGFPMKALVDFAKPAAGAKYVVMRTFLDPKVAPGQRQSWYPWPYTEGLTMAEATHELTFMVTGVYGKPAPASMGSPLRLAVPWKYGFKAVKSIVRFEFTDKRPVSFWEKLQPSEYGFWANVNPDVPHPRWSQAKEQVLGSGDIVPTVIYNGYGEFVADLYKDMKGERLFM
jgi:sulfoxide reductase catalytic subunit YedY